MKRLIGRFVVVGLLSGGAMFSVVSPSSAVPDNRCMDEANYNSQLAWYGDQWSTSYEQFDAWVNADHYVNPVSGQETWDAVYHGATNTVYSSWDYQLHVDYYANQMAQWDAAMSGFMGSWDICP